MWNSNKHSTGGTKRDSFEWRTPLKSIFHACRVSNVRSLTVSVSSCGTDLFDAWHSICTAVCTHFPYWICSLYRAKADFYLSLVTVSVLKWQLYFNLFRPIYILSHTDAYFLTVKPHVMSCETTSPCTSPFQPIVSWHSAVNQSSTFSGDQWRSAEVWPLP